MKIFYLYLVKTQDPEISVNVLKTKQGLKQFLNRMNGTDQDGVIDPIFKTL